VGLNDFWSTSRRANDFLRTGRANDTLRNYNDGFSTVDAAGNWIGGTQGGSDNLGQGGPCTSSSQCPSGWACVDGICQLMNNSGGGSAGGGGPSQQPSPGGGGDCNPNDPNSPCNSGGPGSCQQAPGCGGDDARDCCGTRCCSFGSASSSRPGVHCWCSECPPFPTCSDFCASYLSANGEKGPGCSEGTDGNSCDSCSYCFAGQCEPVSNAPCWCGDGDSCNTGACYKCDTNPDSSNYGDCAIDPSGCQQCGTIRNHLCPCNRILPDITVCKPYGEGGLSPINLAQQEAAKRCDEECKTEPDPCAPKCSQSSYCSDIGTGSTTCPDGTTQVGWMQVGENTCVFCEKCDTSSLPDSCKECDCNCHNDCGECEICGTDGTCHPDPQCEADTYLMEFVVVQNGHYYGYSGPPTIVNCGPLDGEEDVLKSYTVAKENLHKYTVDFVTTPYTQRFESVCSSCIENERPLNDECTGTSACPGTVTIAYPMIDGNVIPYSSAQMEGCKIHEPQGGITTWLFTGGTAFWRATPIFD